MSTGRLAGPRDAAPRERRGRRLLALCAILALLAVVVIGGQVAATALRAPAGEPVAVAPGVRLQPLPGWQLASPQRGTEPALLTRGSGNLAVLAAPTALDAAGLASWYAGSRLAPLASEPLGTTAPVPLRAAGGHRAVALGYRARFGAGNRSGAVAGEIVAVVTPGGTGVVFDAWARPQVFDYLRDDALAMATAAEVR